MNIINLIRNLNLYKKITRGKLVIGSFDFLIAEIINSRVNKRNYCYNINLNMADKEMKEELNEGSEAELRE